MGQGALSKPVVQWWLSLNSSIARQPSGCEPRAGRPPPSALHRALRRMAGLVFLLVFWVLAGACQRHGVGGFLLCNSSLSS